MYTVGLHGEGEIDAVIDQQTGTMVPGQDTQFTGERQKLSR
jgi:hypothetical protein